MKVFIAEPGENQFVSSTDYKWCDDGELLMFGQFQLENSNPTNVSMCGIKTRCFTTRIIVKDLEIDREFYTELLSESVEKSFDCIIAEDGTFHIDAGLASELNIHNIVSELLNKASQFSDGQRVKCIGKTIVATKED